MKNRTKTLSLVLAAAFTLSVGFTACGAKNDTGKDKAASTAPAASPAASAAVEKPKLDPYEVVMYTNGNGEQKDLALVVDHLNKYTKEKINTTLKLVQLDWGSYEPKVQALLATGEKADLVFSCGWSLNYANSAAKGWFTDITDLLPKHAPEAYKLLKEDGFLEASAIGGRNYNMAAIKEKGSQGGIVFNKNLVDKYAIDINSIKKFSDLEPALKTIKEKEPGITPLGMHVGLDIRQAGLAQELSFDGTGSTGAIVFDAAAGKFTPVFENPIAKEWFAVARKFYEAGYIRKDVATLKDMIPDMRAQKIFCMVCPLKPGKAGELSNEYGFPMAQVGLSKVVSTQGDMTSSMYAVPKTSAKPERALMYYNLFYSDEFVLNTFDYGIEGKHYVFVDKAKKQIDFAPETEGGKKSGWNPSMNWMFGNQFLTYLHKNEDPKKWELFKEFNKQAVKSSTFGFEMNQENVKKEIAALANVREEFANAIFSGAMDPEKYLPLWKQKATAAGLDKVIAEANKQFTEFKAKK